MKNIFRAISFLILIIALIQCVSDPITIEIQGPPINGGGGGMSDTLIALVEQNLCDPSIISFERQILPLVISGCAYSGCHDSKSHQEGITLENYSQIRAQVKPNAPSNSKLYKEASQSPNSNDIMPPKPAKVFTAAQLDLIKTWINQGAENTTCNVPCDSKNNMSFNQDILPLITNSCNGCHQQNGAQGGINLEDYDHIKAFALNGQLYGCVSHTFGYEAMPPIGPKFTECQIASIQNWIKEGALDN